MTARLPRDVTLCYGQRRTPFGSIQVCPVRHECRRWTEITSSADPVLMSVWLCEDRTYPARIPVRAEAVE